MSDNTPETIIVGNKALPREARASTCGKAIIVGEHAVVYGAHAVAMPLKQLRMQIELKPALKNHDESSEFHLKLGGKEVSKRISDVFPEAFELLQQPTFSLNAKGHSNLPIGAGLGSSASLCIAIVKVLADSMSLDISPAELAYIGNKLEARFHGNPSGLDTSIVAFEECVYFAKHKEIQAIPQKEECKQSWEFALIDSKVRASTLAMIRLAEPFFKGASGNRHLYEFDQLASQVKDAIPSFHIDVVAEAMNRCHELLNLAGVVPHSLRQMIEDCRELGMPAAKITGAGGGGTIICLLDTERAEEQTKRLQMHFANHPVFRVSI
ncbi:MAG: mevalonate kinase [Oligoflexus sp.]